MSERIRARIGRCVEAAGRAIGKGAGGPTVYGQDGLRIRARPGLHARPRVPPRLYARGARPRRAED